MSNKEISKSPGHRERRKPPSELEPVLQTGGKKLIGGNPPSSRHSPTYRNILTLGGDKVAVLERVTISANGNSSGVEVRVTDKVIRTTELWKEQPRSWTLTHALRLLQLASRYREGTDRAWQEFYPGLTPQATLKESGLSESAAKSVVLELAKLQLLREKQRTAPGSRSQTYWCVNMQMYAISPDNKPVPRHALIDGWRLPEEGSQQPPSSIGEQAEPPKARHEQLGIAWEIIQAIVPADAVIEDNVAKFRHKGPLLSLIAGRLGIPESRASNLCRQLHVLGKYTNIGGGPGLRRLEVSMDEPVIAPEDTSQVSRTRTGRTKQQAAAPPAPEAQESAMPAEPADDPEQLILKLVQRVDHYKTQLSEKEGQVQALEAQLGELKARLAQAERPKLSEEVVRLARETLS